MHVYLASGVAPKQPGRANLFQQGDLLIAEYGPKRNVCFIGRMITVAGKAIALQASQAPHNIGTQPGKTEASRVAEQDLPQLRVRTEIDTR